MFVWQIFAIVAHNVFITIPVYERNDKCTVAYVKDSGFHSTINLVSPNNEVYITLLKKKCCRGWLETFPAKLNELRAIWNVAILGDVGGPNNCGLWILYACTSLVVNTFAPSLLNCATFLISVVTFHIQFYLLEVNNKFSQMYKRHHNNMKRFCPFDLR